MKPANIHNLNYRDNLARKHRRRFFVKVCLLFLIILAAGGGLTYLFFFSSVMRITETNINGLETIESDRIFPIVDSFKNQSFLGTASLKPQFNILFFDNTSLQNKILAEFPVIEKVEILKEFPHRLTINITERTAIGTWCSLASCRYFDRSGAIWGNALRSSGSLLLSIEDLRSLGEKSDPSVGQTIDANILEPIEKTINGLGGLGIKIKKIEIQDGLIGDFKIYTTSRLAEASGVARAGYYLMFNNETKIPEQIKILGILLDQKGKDFNPEYIDLRVEERIYYK